MPEFNLVEYFDLLLPVEVAIVLVSILAYVIAERRALTSRLQKLEAMLKI